MQVQALPEHGHGKRLTMRRAIHLGSWTIFCDIAGQVSESPANPVVTVTAVAVAREGIIASGVVCVAPR